MRRTGIAARAEPFRTNPDGSIVFTGGAGGDAFAGSARGDRLSGNGGDDTLVGGAGRDVLSGGAGDDRLDGGQDADHLAGGIGRDTLIGGDGGDILDGGAGRDLLVGGLGDDRYVVTTGDAIDDWDGRNVIVALEDFVAPYGRNVSYFAEQLIAGSDEGLRLTGGDRIDIIVGAAGDDTLAASPDTDALDTGSWSLFGGAGDDVLIGSDGQERMVGGIGDDIYYATAYDQIVEHPGEGNDTVCVATDYFFLGHGMPDIETVRIVRAEGAYVLGDASDTAFFGGPGADRFVTDRGRDIVTGGDDADVFAYYCTSWSRAGDGIDVIRDFQPGVDIVDLWGIEEEGSGQGLVPNAFIGTDAFSGAGHEVRYRVQGNSTYIMADLDGDRIADFELHLLGVFALTENDVNVDSNLYG